MSLSRQKYRFALMFSRELSTVLPENVALTLPKSAWMALGYADSAVALKSARAHAAQSPTPQVTTPTWLRSRLQGTWAQSRRLRLTPLLKANLKHFRTNRSDRLCHVIENELSSVVMSTAAPEAVCDTRPRLARQSRTRPTLEQWVCHGRFCLAATDLTRIVPMAKNMLYQFDT